MRHAGYNHVGHLELFFIMTQLDLRSDVSEGRELALDLVKVKALHSDLNRLYRGVCQLQTHVDDFVVLEDCFIRQQFKQTQAD